MILLLRLAVIAWGIVVAVLAGCLCLLVCALFGAYLRIENHAVIAMQFAASAIAGTISGVRVAKGMWPKRGASSDELLTAVRHRFPNWAVLTIVLHVVAMAIFALPIVPLLIWGRPKPGLNYPDLGPFISQFAWLTVLVFNGMSTLVCGTMAYSGPENPLDEQSERNIVAWSFFVLALNVGYIALGIWPKN